MTGVLHFEPQMSLRRYFIIITVLIESDGCIYKGTTSSDRDTNMTELYNALTTDVRVSFLPILPFLRRSNEVVQPSQDYTSKSTPAVVEALEMLTADAHDSVATSSPMSVGADILATHVDPRFEVEDWVHFPV